jgi:hypothetical protein
MIKFLGIVGIGKGAIPTPQAGQESEHPWRMARLFTLGALV